MASNCGRAHSFAPKICGYCKREYTGPVCPVCAYEGHEPSMFKHRISNRARLMLAVGVVGLAGFVGTLTAQADDPCTTCQAQHGPACPCLPIAAEPPGGTIPPVAGIVCNPLGSEPDITDCDKSFLPWIGR